MTAMAIMWWAVFTDQKMPLIVWFAVAFDFIVSLIRSEIIQAFVNGLMGR